MIAKFFVLAALVALAKSHAPLSYSLAAPSLYAAPTVQTVGHDPTISEYSTYVASAPAIHETRVHQPAPIVHESYAPAVYAAAAPTIKTIAHEPTISEYSTYVASAPAFRETRVHQAAPIVHESYTAPLVHSVAGRSLYGYAAPYLYNNYVNTYGLNW